MMMLPILGPSLITGGASLLSSFMNSSTSAANTQAQIAAQEQMQGQTEQFNAQQAQVQRDYETTMSNTAYQRASQDMQKAGLNPAMMFSSGSAAGTPSVSAASVGTPNVPMPQKTSPWAGLGQAVSSAVDAGMKGEYYNKMQQEIANMQVEADKSRAITDNLKQTHDIQAPQARDSLIRMGYPDWLANTFVYGGDIAKGVSSAGGALWDLLPSSLFKSGAKMASGRWGNPESAPPVASAPTEAGSSSATAVRRGMDLERNLSLSDRFDNMMKGGSKGLENLLDRWMTGGSKLGGRSPGTGGSYD